MLYKSAIFAFAFAFLIIVITACDDTGPKPITPEEPYCYYMPTSVGNKWEYRVTVESKFNPREEYKLTYEIKSTEQSYKGFPKAYVITVTKEGAPKELYAACDDDICYIERESWAYLMEDDMVIGVWTQTGLVYEEPLEYVRDVNVTVPAGSFQCRELLRDNERESRPQEWHEYYAKDVGLVRYENYYKEYKGSEPPELVDWRNEVHELISYDIQPAPTTQ
jgi:hypothetical protein